MAFAIASPTIGYSEYEEEQEWENPHVMWQSVERSAGSNPCYDEATLLIWPGLSYVALPTTTLAWLFGGMSDDHVYTASKKRLNECKANAADDNDQGDY